MRLIALTACAVLCAITLLAADNNPVSAQDDKDAEHLFQQMEETLLKAKTLDLSFHIADGDEKADERSKGTLVAMSGSKVWKCSARS
jgi:hypothetical protein